MGPDPSRPVPRILVTGGDGFVGRWLLSLLVTRLPKGGRLVAAGRRPPSVDPVEFAHLELTDDDEVEQVVRALQPTSVIHLAAVSAVQEARRAPRRAWAVNLQGTANLSEAVLRHVPQARFVFASTSEVYGGTFQTWTGPVHEQAPLDPTNPYAASKAAADLLIGQMARDGLNAVRFRPFNHTGPGQSEVFVIPAFAAQIARIECGLQEPVIRVGNLEAKRDFLDVRDVVEGYAAVALQELGVVLRPGAIFNLASGVPRRIGDVLDDLLRRARIPIHLERDPVRLRPNDTPAAVGDASRANSLLNWRPVIPWSRTLDDVLEFWRTAIDRG